MKKESVKFDNLNLNYDISQIDKPANILFVDIETTGLSARSSSIYMIGMATCVSDDWYYTALVAEQPNEELEVLSVFLDIIKNYKTLIHFNGNRFDLPFITERCKANGLSIDFNDYNGMDIYKRINPYRHILGIANCKQTTLEQFVGINREDEYSGGELINVYKEYTASGDDKLYKLLYQHNHDDVLGMLSILNILNYSSLFDTDFKVIKVYANTYSDIIGGKNTELLIEFTMPFSIPSQISFNANGCHTSIRDNKGLLKVPIYHEELKYYYDNYSDYYYLPMEDMAVHKSVAMYVDKEFREQAKATTCYTRLVSDFLPEWDTLATPFFKRDYDSNQMFFEFNDEIKTNREFFVKYITHILNMMLECK